MPTAIDQRLASIWHRDRIDLHADVERLASSLDVPFHRLFRALMGIASDNPEAPENEIDAALEAAFREAEAMMRERFERVADKAHKRALGGFAGTVPRKWFRVLGVFRERISEPAKPRPSAEEWEAELARLTFPAPTRQEVHDWLDHKGAEGKNWDERLAYWHADARGQIRAELTQALSAGEGLSTIRGRLKPITDGINYKAQRIARTEGRRVGEMAQQRAIRQAGDLIAAQEILAVLDERTRPEHAARNGERYERQADGRFVNAAGEELPDLPDAPNCRCFASPILAPADELVGDPALGADFTNAEADVIPDPSAYADWFAAAGEAERMAAVGSDRYNAVMSQLGRRPEWADFLEPDGRLAKAKTLRRETPLQQTARRAAVDQTIAGRDAMLAHAQGTGPKPTIEPPKPRPKPEPTPPTPATVQQVAKSEIKTAELQQRLDRIKADNAARRAELQQLQQANAEKKRQLAAARAESDRHAKEVASMKAKIRKLNAETKAIDRKLRKEDIAHDALLKKKGITGFYRLPNR